MGKNLFLKKLLLILSGISIIFCIGIIYAWSIFVTPLKELYNFTQTQTQIIFSTVILVFSITMIFSGKWHDKSGPRVVAFTGGIILGLGYILASFTKGSFPGLVLTLGVISGIGVGLSYVCPLGVLVKWFPHKKGIISGLVLSGFGAGAWFFSQLSVVFLSNFGLMKSFFYLGIIFSLVMCVSALVLSNPPQGWMQSYHTKINKNTQLRNLQSFEMIRTKSFWILWIKFMLGASAGLLVIGNIKPFGLSQGITYNSAAAAVGILSIFNGLGRIIWGWVSDKFGRMNAMFVIFLFQGIMMLSLIKMASGTHLFYIASACVGFNFGGLFSVFLATTADYFGTKYLGENYGFVFTSYGIAGVIGPILGGSVFDMTGSFLYAFIPSGIMCFIACGLTLINRHPKEVVKKNKENILEMANAN